MTPTTPRRVPPRAVVGAEALAALAVPARYAILNHLLAAGPRTASQCAAIVGETPSNCSWHLRALAKVGLVEPAEQSGGDARARPWQASAAGFDFSGSADPAGKVAARVISGLAAQSADELYHRFLARQDLLPARWAESAGENNYSLTLTPDELTELVGTIDALIRPFVRSIRPDLPAGGGTVQMTLRAFLNPDVGEPVDVATT